MATSPRPAPLTHAEVAALLGHEQLTAPRAVAATPRLGPPPHWSYLDVRTPQEFATGHVPGAYNIPYQLGDLAGLHPNPTFLHVVRRRFSEGTPLIIGCRSGARATAAERALTAAGYVELRVHLGSLMGARDAFGRVRPGWVQSGYAVSDAPLPGRSHSELEAAILGAEPTPERD